MKWIAALLAGLLPFSAVDGAGQPSLARVPDVAPRSAPAGQTVAAPGQVFDLASAVTGRTYRISIYVPTTPSPPAGFPVVYFLDGNYDFNIAVQTAKVQAATGEIPAGVVIGIGYPTDNGALVHTLRVKDLSLPAQPAQRPAWMITEDVPVGDAEAFYRALITEIRPFVEAHAPIDRRCQTLYGHSLGGLFTLHALFRHPEDFRSYVAASPSIWWADEAVLADERAFVGKLRAGTPARLMMTAGAREQTGTPASPSGLSRMRMVSNPVELAERLAPYRSDKVAVETHVLEGETHNSSVPAVVSKTLRFGFCPAS